MQRMSNSDRTDRTRRALLEVARELFVTKGYAETSTPEIVSSAQMTRGALYHHFEDKRALFRAVVEAEAMAVAAEIEAATPPNLAPREALRQGSMAYLRAMTTPGRTRLLLVEGPAVLGDELTQLDEENAARTLREGIEAARFEGEARSAVSTDILAMLLSAAFDRAALAVSAGADEGTMGETMAEMIERLV
ncbi:MAG: TetR/AcrR family transcriptional regulator [Devosia nanyangense]|jgi:AcrR family transcriptional regulator|nr:TetR/AcrR family transcriptional regulator [Devosia nanyangense]